MLYKNYIKRILDIFLAVIIVVCLWWLFLAVAVLVRIKMGKPALFAQICPGKGERLFKLYKFRSMTDKKDKDGKLLPDTERLTPFGKILRKTSLDELPELWNILCGDMSFVGPRPLAVQYLPYYTETERRRHMVRPGLTGLAQVNGRNALSWEERFRLDVEYVDKISFAFDIYICLKTIKTILHPEDVIVRGEGEVRDLDEERRRRNESGE